MRTRCLDCRAWAEPGKSRCYEHSARQEAMWNGTRKLNRQARLAGGTNAAARLRKAVDKAGFSVCSKCGLEYPASAVDVDHRTALGLGGKDVEENVQVLCKPHHVEKTREDRRRMC